ncbi:MAG: phosphate acyltransferase PlsX [Clostridia bacterium]|nr:phosphate acyltransferase PlsX [Clostridia bacterium]
MRIAVDAFGGDNAPVEVVAGAVKALGMDENLEIVLVGKPAVLADLLNEYGNPKRISVCEAQDVIDCNESPTIAIRRKKDSSLVKTFGVLEEADGAVSAGSTGAVLAGGIFLCGRIKGVKRPALCPVLPTVKGGHVILADCGANTDCKPEYLVQFAQMGVAYMQCLYGLENPRVGLLSNGAEEEKGNELTKAAHALLKESDLNFVGNAEAREILSGDYDVVVADGFDGNVALKSAEGTAGAVFTLLKEGINSSFRAKLGALMLKPVLKKIKKTMDYTEYGGAAFVGINKPLVKVHGSAKAKTFAAAILQCAEMAKGDLVGKLSRTLRLEDE